MRIVAVLFFAAFCFLGQGCKQQHIQPAEKPSEVEAFKMLWSIQKVQTESLTEKNHVACNFTQLKQANLTTAQHSQGADSYWVDVRSLNAADEFAGYKFKLQCAAPTSGDAQSIYSLTAAPSSHEPSNLHALCIQSPSESIHGEPSGSAEACLATFAEKK